MQNLTIYNLRKDMGYKVRVTHSRLVKIDSKLELITMRDIREKNLQNQINAKGGLSLIEVTDQKGNNYSASTKCSKKDGFNRKVANSILLGRLVKEMNISLTE